jgi:hypothetical protein
MFEHGVVVWHVKYSFGGRRVLRREINRDEEFPGGVHIA